MELIFYSPLAEKDLSRCVGAVGESQLRYQILSRRFDLASFAFLHPHTNNSPVFNPPTSSVLLFLPCWWWYAEGVKHGDIRLWRVSGTGPLTTMLSFSSSGLLGGCSLHKIPLLYSDTFSWQDEIYLIFREGIKKKVTYYHCSPFFFPLLRNRLKSI